MELLRPHLVLLQTLTGDWPRSLASLMMSRTAMPKHSSWASWLPGTGTRSLSKSLRHYRRVGREGEEQGELGSPAEARSTRAPTWEKR